MLTLRTFCHSRWWLYLPGKFYLYTYMYNNLQRSKRVSTRLIAFAFIVMISFRLSDSIQEYSNKHSTIDSDIYDWHVP